MREKEDCRDDPLFVSGKYVLTDSNREKKQRDTGRRFRHKRRNIRSHMSAPKYSAAGWYFRPEEVFFGLRALVLISEQAAFHCNRNRLIASVFNRVQKNLVRDLPVQFNHGGFFCEVDRGGRNAVQRGERFGNGGLAMVAAHTVDGDYFFHDISFLSRHMIFSKLQFVNSLAEKKADYSSFLWQSPLMAQEEQPQLQEAGLPSFFFLSMLRIMARTITNKAAEIKIVAIIVISISAAVQRESALHAAAIDSKNPITYLKTANLLFNVRLPLSL